MKKAIYKVPNGKLVKIFLEDEDGAIKKITVTGDFFLYPEEHLEKLEEAFGGAQLTQESLRKILSDFLEKNPTTFFGVDNESLISTILAAAASPTTSASPFPASS